MSKYSDDERANFVTKRIGGDTDSLPVTYTEAMNSGASRKWREAVEAELDALRSTETWKEVPTPKHKQILATKWVFTNKRGAIGNLQEYEARLVSKSFEQGKGRAYD